MTGFLINNTITVVSEITVGDIVAIAIAFSSVIFYVVGRAIIQLNKAYYNYSTIIIEDNFISYEDQQSWSSCANTNSNNAFQSASSALNEDETAYEELLDESNIVKIGDMQNVIVTMKFSEPIKWLKLCFKPITINKLIGKTVYKSGVIYVGQSAKFALYMNDIYPEYYFKYRRVDGSLGLIEIAENLKDGGYSIKDSYKKTPGSFLFYFFSH